ADTREDGKPPLGRLSGRGGSALPDFSLAGVPGLTPAAAWPLALGLAALSWWALYRAFHSMTMAEEPSLQEEAAAAAESSAGIATLPLRSPEDDSGETAPELHPQLAADLDGALAEQDHLDDEESFEALEKELAGIASIDSLENALTRLTAILRERWGVSG